MATNGGDLKNIKQLGSLSPPELAPEEGQALQKHRTFFPLGSLGKALSTMEGACPAIHGLPVGTAKKEKRSHGQACCRHRMFYAADGWARERTARSPAEASRERWAQELPKRILQVCVEVPHK